MDIRIAAVIPARMASSRFPGKPLLPVRGLPMVEHVRRRALLCRRFSDVVVATCDPQIAEAVTGYGGRCLMTSPAHPGATDRVAEAMQQVECTHVMNVQGDEILVLPEDLERMVRAIEAEPDVPAWNAVAPLESDAELGDRSIVKCAVSVSGRIMFCARDFTSLVASSGSNHLPIRKLLGLTAYRRDWLAGYRSLPRTPIEQAGSMDQSRIIEHDVLLRGIELVRGYPGINEPREVPAVEALLAEDPAQRTMLETILRS